MKVDEWIKRVSKEIRSQYVVSSAKDAEVAMRHEEMVENEIAEIITAEYAKNMPWADFKDVLAARAAWEELREAARMSLSRPTVGRSRLIKALSSLPKEGQ